MSDEMKDTGSQPTAEGPSEASAAWKAVVAELDALGDALGKWLKAAANDPDNKRRLDELSTRLEGLVDGVGGAVKGAADSEVGQSFKEAADKTGEAFKTAGEKIGEEVGPKLAGAFRTLGDKLRGAAEKMEEKRGEQEEPPAGPDAGGPSTGAE